VQPPWPVVRWAYGDCKIWRNDINGPWGPDGSQSHTPTLADGVTSAVSPLSTDIVSPGTL